MKLHLHVMAALAPIDQPNAWSAQLRIQHSAPQLCHRAANSPGKSCAPRCSSVEQVASATKPPTATQQPSLPPHSQQDSQPQQSSQEPWQASRRQRSQPAAATSSGSAEEMNAAAVRNAQTSELEHCIWKPPDDIRRERRLNQAQLVGFQHAVAEEWLSRHGKSQPAKARK